MDKNLLQGARNAVRVCMNLTPSDRVFILTDQQTEEIARALETEAKAAGAETVSFAIESFGQRPMTDFPETMKKQLASFAPTVTFYAASVQPNELKMRGGFISFARELNARHAHMPGITTRIMREGMRVDYNQLHKISRQVLEIVGRAKSVHVTSREGTDLHVRFDSQYRWISSDGLIHKPGSFSNLPDGEVETCPASAEGTFVSRVLGDYFCVKYGILPSPVTFQIADSRVTRVSSQQNEIAAEISAYLDSDENGRRIGEFAIGTNLGVKNLIGSMLQDEKIPGVHIACGDPLGFMSGATWTSRIHVDIVNPYCSIDADGKPLMKKGRFTFN